jgi:hypothetical protein
MQINFAHGLVIVDCRLRRRSATTLRLSAPEALVVSNTHIDARAAIIHSLALTVAASP